MEELKLLVLELSKDINEIKNDIKILKEGQQRIESKIDNKDALNASRHIEINTKIDNISNELNIVEAVTKDNLYDIAKLKAVK